MASRLEISGPVDADLVHIRDADTIKVRAHIWPGQVAEVFVRIRDIDTPELSGRCPWETARAQEAKQVVEQLLRSGRVTLARISGGKYFGRVLADVTSQQGTNIAHHLLKSGHAVPYKGRKRPDWCMQDHF